MLFNFKKIASVLTSAVMLSSTIGFAAAATYPAPFVVDGLADGAVVYGANAAISDVTAAIDLQQKLGALATSGTATTSASVSGEAAALFSGGTKLYVNDSLNSVKSVLTKSELPIVLADQSFSGNVDATVTHSINIGSNPRITFDKQPTTSDDPNYALTTSTTQANYIYNATATFNKAVNLSNSDSEGETITLFGQDFTIAASSDSDTLVLLKSAEKISLSSDNPTADVTVGGETYTVELVSASDDAATIKVTDSAGTSASREISEAASKKVNDVTIAVTTADETNIKLSASIVVGADKLTLEDGSSVTEGDDATTVDGTVVDFGTTGESTENMTSLTISVYASESDEDAIKAGEVFTDPVFGNFKLDFSGFNIESDPITAGDVSSRETITVAPSSDDKLDLTFTDHRGHEKTITWVVNSTGSKTPQLMADDDYRNISVFESEAIHDEEIVVVGNEDEGYLLKLSNVKNQSSGYSSDIAQFKDVFTDDTYDTVWTADGSGTITIGGKSYSVTLAGAHTVATEAYTVRLDYPDSSGNGVAVIYPTIQTSKGAKIGLYEPITISLNNWDGASNALTELKFPKGDGYTSVESISYFNDTNSRWNFTTSAGVQTLDMNDTSGADSFTATIGQLKYNFTTTSGNSTKIMLLNVAENANIDEPAMVIFEEKDDNSDYQALIVEVEEGGSGDDGVGVDSVEDTWSNAGTSWSKTRASDSKMEDRADLWGTIVTIDGSDSDQKSATISYPDEQIYAQIYMAEESASITPGSTGSSSSGGQVMIVTDSEVSTVASKNLLVVGGSCINTVAAKILGFTSPTCGADFTAATEVGEGEYLIKVVTSPYSDDATAMLVAGYEKADTLNAIAKAKEGVSTDIGYSQVYPITSTGTETEE